MYDYFIDTEMSNFDGRYFRNDVEVAFHFGHRKFRSFFAMECEFCDLHNNDSYSDVFAMTRIIIDESILISIEKGTIWYPVFDTDVMKLGSLNMRGIESTLNEPSENYRYKSIDIIKNWSPYVLYFMSVLQFQAMKLEYLTANDFACVPNLVHIEIIACDLRFFSGLSANVPSKNYYVEYNSVEYMKNIERYSWYESRGINNNKTQKLIQEIGLFRSSVNSSETYWEEIDKKQKKTCLQPTFRYLKNLVFEQNSLSDDTFIFNASVFPNLTNVNLSYNLFTQIPIFESIGTTQVQKLNIVSLNLSHSKITDLRNIKRLGNLTNLLLNSNHLSVWDSSDVFVSDHHHISNVNLESNLISKLGPVMLDSLSNECDINIENNPFDCDDCSLPDFQKWIREKRDSFSNLRCVQPSNLTGIAIIQVDFDLEKCLLPKDFTWLVYSTFSPLIIFIIALSIFAYVNRFRITYMFHLLHMRRKINNSNNDNADKIWQFDAFVSYSKNDEVWVKTILLPELEDREKYKLCLQERDFKIGAFILDNIEENILCSRHAILVISPNFVANNLCQWELKLIQRSFDLSPSFLILVELERLTHKDLPTNFRLLMGTRTYLEWSAQNVTRFWERLKQALGSPLHTSQSESTQDFSREQQNGPTEEEVGRVFNENVQIAFDETDCLLSD